MSSNDASEHDIRQILPGTKDDPPIYGDFSPTENEPDLDVWPQPHDTGAPTFSGDPNDLYLITGAFPEPHVRFVTCKQFKAELGYPPNNLTATLSNEELAAVEDATSLTVTEDRYYAFHRIAKLWCGELAGPRNMHLLVDKVPGWTELFSDLNQNHLAPLQPTPNPHHPDVTEAFGDYSWFPSASDQGGWLKTTYVARQKAPYDLEENARTLINKRDDLPSLPGDPHEGLAHRFAVGCEAARANFVEDRDIATYVDINGYTVDLLERDNNGTEYAVEVLTEHNNYGLYRSTWEKLEALELPAILIFDNRETAYRVLNHWHDRGLADVPGAPFDSSPRLDWTREKFREEAQDWTSSWPVEELLTTTKVWDLVFNREYPPTTEQLLSLDW